MNLEVAFCYLLVTYSVTHLGGEVAMVLFNP
jgi:hypothetical protein